MGSREIFLHFRVDHGVNSVNRLAQLHSKNMTRWYLKVPGSLEEDQPFFLDYPHPVSSASQWFTKITSHTTLQKQRGSAHEDSIPQSNPITTCGSQRRTHPCNQLEHHLSPPPRDPYHRGFITPRGPALHSKDQYKHIVGKPTRASSHRGIITSRGPAHQGYDAPRNYQTWASPRESRHTEIRTPRGPATKGPILHRLHNITWVYPLH